MQLGFQTIPELNAQVLETYIGVIIQNTRMCTGACLAPAAQHWGQTGLGPGAHTALPAELAPLLLWLGDHLVHGSLGGGVYTYANDMGMHTWVAILK